MKNKTYIVATIRPWNIKIFEEILPQYPGQWHLVTKREDLTVDVVRKLKPRYIFFPHWSYIVPKEILDLADCVCFHMADVPYGRGGSPLQNLIATGHKETTISALRMVEELDAGPVYSKRPLSLLGLAEEIYMRCSAIVADMILEIAKNEPVPKPQEGEPTVFKRRKPEQSELPKDTESLEAVFDHIRMLDAAEYPRAYVRHGNLRLEISRPALRSDAIEADVRITLEKAEEE